jgi:hypothetical protein
MPNLGAQFGAGRSACACGFRGRHPWARAALGRVARVAFAACSAAGNDASLGGARCTRGVLGSTPRAAPPRALPWRPRLVLLLDAAILCRFATSRNTCQAQDDGLCGFA